MFRDQVSSFFRIEVRFGGHETNRNTSWLLVSQNNLRFELANIIFNLAALYSQLAYATNRTTADGLKQACNYLCSAAGVLSHLRTDIIPDLRTSPPEDMDEVTLQSLELLLLGQGQECFWQKAVKDGLKDVSIAKLAAKVSDFYGDAGDLAVKSNAISTDWIHHMTAKHHHFAAAAQFRQALDCLEKRKYGEEVARLRDCLVCVGEGLKEQRWINRTVLGDLNGLKSRVVEDLKRAEKDNDIIYINPVPPKSELKTIERASMVLAKAPSQVTDAISMLGDNGPLGQPLFSKLVPYAVHIAASIYTDRRDRLVNDTLIGELESMSDKLREYVFNGNTTPKGNSANIRFKLAFIAQFARVITSARKTIRSPANACVARRGNAPARWPESLAPVYRRHRQSQRQ